MKIFQKIKISLPWCARIFMFLLFVISGVSKLFPIWAFEKQLVDLGFTTWCQAHYVARILIGLEIAIGISFLNTRHLRTVSIPLAAILLVFFTAHLGIQIYEHGPNNGNCGCFGQLIPMTPIQALIKNIFALIFLFYLSRIRHSFSEIVKVHPIIILIVSTSFVFILKSFCPCELLTAADPIPVKSKFSDISDFSHGKLNLDQDKKVVCFFVPGCEDCRKVASELCLKTKGIDFPEVVVIFMEEETHLIPEFFSEAECKFPYIVLDVISFWRLLGDNKNTPGVFFQWNGNTIISFDGADSSKFDFNKLNKAINTIPND